jgi:hypothetical protein
MTDIAYETLYFFLAVVAALAVVTIVAWVLDKRGVI